MVKYLPADLLEGGKYFGGIGKRFFFACCKQNKKSDSDIEEKDFPSVTDIYRILVEQIPAVVFIAFFDKGFRRSLRQSAD